VNRPTRVAEVLAMTCLSACSAVGQYPDAGDCPPVNHYSVAKWRSQIQPRDQIKTVKRTSNIVKWKVRSPEGDFIRGVVLARVAGSNKWENRSLAGCL
jgi:hypothetical protein